MTQLWHAKSYDTEMKFVSEFGQSLLELLQPRQGERILDWGSGTGDLAAKIAESGAEVVGIDGSAEMVAEARRKYPQLTFVHADGQQYVAPQPADAIFSNAALHWMQNAEGAAASLSASLRHGGRLVAEFGGAGNIARILEGLTAAFAAVDAADKLRFPWYFPTVGQYASLLERSGLRVDFAACFDRPTPLMGGEKGLREWLRIFAGSILQALPPEQQELVISRLEQELRPALFTASGWLVDYRRIGIIAYKL